MPILGTAPSKTYTRSDGTRTGAAVCQQEESASLANTSVLADARENDLATAINMMLMKDGGNQATTNLPMGGNKHTGVAAGTTSGEYAEYSQMVAADGVVSAAYIAADGVVSAAYIAADAVVVSGVASGYQPLNSILTDLSSHDTIPAPVGTRILFRQTTAPTGWTKDTADNNAAIRIVSGSISDGGTADFTTVFAARTIAASNLPVTSPWSIVDPGHTHPYVKVDSGTGIAGGGGFGIAAATTSVSGTNITLASNSGGGNSMDFAVKYVSIISATRNAR